MLFNTSDYFSSSSSSQYSNSINSDIDPTELKFLNSGHRLDQQNDDPANSSFNGGGGGPLNNSDLEMEVASTLVDMKWLASSRGNKKNKF